MTSDVLFCFLCTPTLNTLMYSLHGQRTQLATWSTPSGQVHPNLNLTDPEDEVSLDVLIGDTHQALDIDVALSNSFGFGGHNSCIMFRSFKNGGAGPAASATAVEVPSYLFRSN